MVDKERAKTTLPNLLNNFLFTTKLNSTNTAEQQSQNGTANFIIAQLWKAKTLSP